MMPLGRYFAWVGGLLLALLFLFDWYAPQPVTPSAEAATVDRSIIRIRSAHRWPGAVVYDTTQPAIALPAQLAWSEPAPAAKPVAKTPPREALALAQAADVPTAVAQAVPSKPVKRRVRTARPAPVERFANSEPFGFRPFAAGW
jgi:hypothetical protein